MCFHPKYIVKDTIFRMTVYIEIPEHFSSKNKPKTVLFGICQMVFFKISVKNTVSEKTSNL